MRAPVFTDEDKLPITPWNPAQAGPGILSQALAKPSFFGQGGTGRNVVGYIGDAISRMAGGPAIFAQAQQQQREQDNLLKRGMIANQLDLARQKELIDYRAAHAPAPEATSTERTYTFLKGLDPTLAQSYITNQATAPPLVVPNSDGTRTVYPQGSIPRMAAPTQPQILQQLPPGVKPYNGGAGQAAPRTFR